MRLGRITQRFDDLPDLHVFECRACDVSHVHPYYSTLDHVLASSPLGGNRAGRKRQSVVAK
jgi:hypothetical protein